MKFEFANSVKNGRAMLMAAVLVGSGPMLAACSGDSTDAAAAPATADVVLATASTSVGDADVENLLFMRQEEKLAADVYRALYEMWGLKPFANIEQAELTHQSEVAQLLADFGIDDPVAELEAGEFIDSELQALYDDLIERGSVSAEEALMVGALIEEVDIADLRERASDVPEIDDLYSRLEQGSNNHLRAFVRNLERYGVDYVAQVLDADDVDSILASENTMGHGATDGTGAQNGQGHGNQQNGQGRGNQQHSQGGQGMGQGHRGGRS